MKVCPVTSTSDSMAVTGTAATMAPAMTDGSYWGFVCSVACWVKQGTAAALAISPATAADGSMYIPAGVVVLFDGTIGDSLSVIRDSTSGTASLTRAKVS